MELSRGNIDRSRWGEPLHRAAYEGNLEEVIALVKEGADVNSINSEQCSHTTYTPLHCSTYEGHRLITEYLLENGANLNVQNELGFTPLNGAIWNGHEDIAAVLLERNPDVNLQSIHGYTPLMSACLKSSYKIVHTLLEKGANVHLVANLNGQTWTAFHAATQNKDLRVLQAVIYKWGNEIVQHAVNVGRKQQAEFITKILGASVKTEGNE